MISIYSLPDISHPVLQYSGIQWNVEFRIHKKMIWLVVLVILPHWLLRRWLLHRFAIQFLQLLNKSFHGDRCGDGDRCITFACSCVDGEAGLATKTPIFSNSTFQMTEGPFVPKLGQLCREVRRYAEDRISEKWESKHPKHLENFCFPSTKKCLVQDLPSLPPHAFWGCLVSETYDWAPPRIFLVPDQSRVYQTQSLAPASTDRQIWMNGFTVGCHWFTLMPFRAGNRHRTQIGK